ncbi:MAG: hypothetical protein QM645_03785 [Asticcacaulis sp.]
MPPHTTSALFRQIEALQGDTPWGRFLDAGTGVNSALWAQTLNTDTWVGITGAEGHARQVSTALGHELRPQDKLIVSNWMDNKLLEGHVFDTVLADYLVGAIEGFAPYFQSQIFRRLAPHVGKTLYIVGLDPYIVGDVSTEAGQMVRAIGRLRDSCLLLADETPYREYPAEWVANAASDAGFEILSAQRFPNRYKEKWVNGQLDMALRRLPKLRNTSLAAALSDEIEALREKGLRLCREENGLRYGADYVIACRTTAPYSA